MEKFYQFQAGGYDSFRENLLHARQDLLDAIQFKKQTDQVWIDVGGGTARNLEYVPPEILRQYFKKIVIIDVSPTLLETARQRVEENGLSDIVELIEHDF